MAAVRELSLVYSFAIWLSLEAVACSNPDVLIDTLILNENSNCYDS